jgi:hypothetical protein
MAESLRARAARTARRVAPRKGRPGWTHGLESPAKLGAKVARLQTRVAELEADVQENRQLNVRLAELTDVVEQLLLPVAHRDEERLAEALARYSTSL